MDFIIECKITPGMELFEQQYFTEGHEKEYTNLNFSLQNSCTPQVLNDMNSQCSQPT